MPDGIRLRAGRSYRVAIRLHQRDVPWNVFTLGMCCAAMPDGIRLRVLRGYRVAIRLHQRDVPWNVFIGYVLRGYA